ncbi:MAG: amidohydrolase [Lachnospiraceae bacterium]|nr:amidohydrolase [Lachnospiraceae bacterium]
MRKFYNAKLLTMEGEPEIINDAVVVVDGDRIAYAGPREKAGPEEKPGPDDMDCRGNLLMPGFKNAHAHSAMTLMRSYADGLPLQEWLTQKIFPLEARFKPEQISAFTKLAILEYLSSGITACFDMYLAPEDTARACEDMGFRCVQVGNVNNFSSSVQYIGELFDKLNVPGSLNSYILGCHAEYTCSVELLRSISELAHSKKAPLFLHVNETEREALECREKYGMPTLCFLDSLGFFDYGGGIYHGVHMTDEELDIMEKRGLSVVLNPGSNIKLASGMAPVSEYLKRGINCALGTDGASSNNALNMFREMYLVSGLSKLRDKDASAVPAKEVLKMATVNGSDCMGLGSARTLSEGQQADMIMIDLQAPNMRPGNDTISDLVFSCSDSNVLMTMVAGKILYYKGEYKTCDVEKLYAEVDDICRDLGM